MFKFHQLSTLSNFQFFLLIQGPVQDHTLRLIVMSFNLGLSDVSSWLLLGYAL